MTALYKSEEFKLIVSLGVNRLSWVLSDMKEFKRQVLNKKVYYKNYGLCSALFSEMSVNIDCMSELFKYFHNYSGNRAYPIEGGYTKYSANEHRRYNLNVRYGKQRLKLLEFIIKVFERALKTAKSQ